MTEPKTPILVEVTAVGYSKAPGGPMRSSFDVRHPVTHRTGGFTINSHTDADRIYFLAWRSNHFAFPFDALVFTEDVRWRV